MEAIEFFLNIDYYLLEKQKSFLANLLLETRESEKDYIEGLLSLIDGIEDTAEKVHAKPIKL